MDNDDFIGFAAIQIFAAMNVTYRANQTWEKDAEEAWQLAKMLYDAKPKDDEATKCQD